MKDLLPDSPLRGQGGDVDIVDTPPPDMRQIVLFNGNIVGLVKFFVKHLRETPRLVGLNGADRVGGLLWSSSRRGEGVHSHDQEPDAFPLLLFGGDGLVDDQALVVTVRNQGDSLIPHVRLPAFRFFPSRAII